MYLQRRGRLRHYCHPYLQTRPLYTGSYQPHQRTNEIRKHCIDIVEEKIRVDKNDKITAKKLVDDVLRTLIAEVRRQPGGQIYGVNVTNAGSYPVNTKIGKADEFDTNIPLNLTLKKVHREGKIKYSETPNSLYRMIYGCPTTTTLQHAVNPVNIPPGHRVIEIDRASLPPKFQHTGKSSYSPLTPAFHPSSIVYRMTFPPKQLVRQETLLNSGTVEDSIQVIPKDIKNDLSDKLRRAIKTSNLEGIVRLQGKAHGPALTLMYKSGAIQSVRHYINIDIVASVSYNVNMSAFGWPRSETMRAFSADLIDRVLQAGTHLVPKHDLYWSVSFSRMERALQSGFDGGFGSRKFVLRILKKFVQKWKSRDPKLRDISSHIMKTQLFWSCEMHCDEPGYWHRSNRDICLINTMKELEDTLRAGVLPDYFFEHINVLDGKHKWSLLSLAGYISQKRLHLMLIPNLGYMPQNKWIEYGVSMLLQ